MNLSYYIDGEDANAAVLNRPLMEIEAAIDILEATDSNSYSKTEVDALNKVYESATSSGTASYTISNGDAGGVHTSTSASANNLVIPTNASVAIPVNTRIDLYQGGAGKMTITGPGVTIRGMVGSRGQYHGMSLWKKASNEWVVFGGGP